jgi:uncharacterized protein YebE (UPF0316 family)
MTPETLVVALVIFALRVLNYSISTVRMVAITRGQRLLAASLASVEALIFAVVIARVVNDLSDLPALIAYCLGASVGSWLGMVLEGRLIKSYMIVNIITNFRGHDIATAMRDAGFGVIEMRGEGRDGVVTTLRSAANKRDIPVINNLVRQISPEAFVTTEEARALQRGWLRPNHRLGRW